MNLFDADNRRVKALQKIVFVYPNDLELYPDGHRELQRKWRGIMKRKSNNSILRIKKMEAENE